MKKEFSFYEFVGIIVPSVIFLFCCELVYEYTSGLHIVNYSTIGDAVIFIILAYGLGHIIQTFGNYYEKIIWGMFNGMPTTWITKSPLLFKKSFSPEQVDKIKVKLYSNFGQSESNNYGRDVYNVLVIKQLTARTDIFNGNYSLFRGLAVVFIIMAVITLYFLSWKSSTIFLSLYLISSVRMIHFGKLYATEIYRTFLNLP